MWLQIRLADKPPPAAGGSHAGSVTGGRSGGDTPASSDYNLGMGAVLLLLLAPLVMWAITEVLEHWASTTYLWVMGAPVLAAHGSERKTNARAGPGVRPTATTTLRA